MVDLKKKRERDLPVDVHGFIEDIRPLFGRHDAHTVWHDFIGVCACSISNAVDKVRFSSRERLYLNTVARYNKEDLDVMSKLFASVVLALERNPRQDFLGTVYQHLGIQQHSPGSGIYTLSY